MNRSPFELEYWVREHAAQLEHGADSWRRTRVVAPDRPPRSWNARRAVGLRLIRAGQRLAGDPAPASVATPRPVA